ncbi:uncharacterized protein K452DRAFT_262169 [Aplosporella prunicola CBS 121167]|uniref:Zn(2)-C6 fungal-type domain-containing protein n=1 Tax=Aplosporella prunicola CBS 121167 TaxID=1176127 RepID=A0A6A6BXX8_9PEZI|nr:uncharacterized protein K452DRAFT_262169 [Aplosporella prunicola CBS 121167]KAF2147591.1 hypothetical protein K452DRAFT_262169 [Aplosporella prunicola CBS 121167]
MSSCTTRPSSLACIECRKRHLKCSASVPVCSRCSLRGLQCVYKPSRRGQRGPPSNHVDLLSPVSGSRIVQSTSATSNNGLPFSSADVPAPATFPLNGEDPVALAAQEASSLPAGSEHLVNLYYNNFHPAHPILVPRDLYQARSYPSYLASVVTFIGSHFSSSCSSDSLRAIAINALSDFNMKTATMVQARLLCAIALHAENERELSNSLLGAAVDLAIEIGMHQKAFAILYGEARPIEEESLRRTWWELYVVDGYLAALDKKSEFKTNAVNADVLLPCEEFVYADGACLPSPLSLADFDQRIFGHDELQFSSFCYRIEATRILSRVLALDGMREVHQDQLQAVDNALAGWSLHLPPTKADIMNEYGELDEMLFQAYMIIQFATIFLHSPRSGLMSALPTCPDIPCIYSKKQAPPAQTQHMHAVKATEASKQVSNLAALRWPVQKHTPFFICGVVIGAIIQLSTCSKHSGLCLEQHRDHVSLIIGVLKSFSQNWTIAHVAVTQIKKVGAEILRPKPFLSQRDSALDTLEISPGNDPWFDLLNMPTLQGLAEYEAETNQLV